MDKRDNAPGGSSFFLVYGMYTGAGFKQCYWARVDIFHGPMIRRLLLEKILHGVAGLLQ